MDSTSSTYIPVQGWQGKTPNKFGDFRPNYRAMTDPQRLQPHPPDELWRQNNAGKRVNGSMVAYTQHVPFVTCCS